MAGSSALLGAGCAWRFAWVVAAALMLADCADATDFHEITTGPANNGPFASALAGNYAYLAHSLQGHDVDVAGASDSLGEVFAQKATAAERGEEVAPEAPSFVAGAETARAELEKLLTGGAREASPATAARAQAGYDCWVLNARAKRRQRAAASCQATFENARRMADLIVNPPPASGTFTVVAQATDPPDYIVFFGFDEWNLSGAALQTITDAVQYAHDSRASHIDVLGHADTSGSAAYNQKLSERRASVVREVMIQMGARSAAVTARGVGERDLAVPTLDGVRETRNRRSVVTMIPMESRVSAR